MITVVCADDGCTNTLVPNQRGRPRLYCADCSTKAAYNRSWRKGETHALPLKPRVTLLPREAVCDSCGEPYTQTFARQLYRGRSGQPRSGKSPERCRAVVREFVLVECEGCGKPFEARARDHAKGWARFCWKRCA
jgi:hypothetical protein